MWPCVVVDGLFHNWNGLDRYAFPLWMLNFADTAGGEEVGAVKLLNCKMLLIALWDCDYIFQYRMSSHPLHGI